MSETYFCPKCGAQMKLLTGGAYCPACGCAVTLPAPGLMPTALPPYVVSTSVQSLTENSAEGRRKMTDTAAKIDAAKKELNGYYDLVRKTRNLKNNLDELRGRMESIKVFQGGERVSASKKNTDTLEYYIDKCAALEAKIAANIWEMSAKQDEMTSKINSLAAPLAEILYKRYIERKRFEKIAVECNYSWRHTMRLNHEALLAYAAKMA